jgi:hypothetical protein
MESEKLGRSFFGVARKRDLRVVAIAICKLHVALACDIQVIHFGKRIRANIS